MGRGGERWCAAFYGHLGQVRHWGAVVEYRVEQYVARLGQRLAAWNARTFGTTIDTAGLDRQPYRLDGSAVTSRA